MCFNKGCRRVAFICYCTFLQNWVFLTGKTLAVDIFGESY
jgi:hypothetical protein